ncbi:MAG: LysR family transcriptional regulator [Burkholderiaceae bacterium]|nr:LysR family transcriptional regulator [Burkholderiaceae bacterium]
MRVFERVVDEGGFAAAARALDMSPAAVTRLVGNLEKHLGARLMHRTTRKLALTDAGEVYLLRVRGILHEIDDAEVAVGSSVQELQGTVHILASPLLGSYFLAPRIAKWRERYPKVALEISVDPFPQSRVDEFDVTFMAVDEGYDASVVARPLARTEWILCAAPAYLKRAGTPLKPQDLAQHDYLKFPWQQSGGSSNRRLRLCLLQSEGEAVDVDMTVVLQSASFDVLYRAALNGAGITVLSRLLVAPHLVSGELVHLLPNWMFGRSTIYVAVPSRKLIPARTRAFLAYVSQLSDT